MYIVKETDEESINKATELAGERSKKLADTIKDILTLRRDKLSVEIIEEAIEIVDGKKKPTDLIPCKPISNAYRSKFLTDLLKRFVHIEKPKKTLWAFTEKPEGICWALTEEPKGTYWAFAKDKTYMAFPAKECRLKEWERAKSKISPYHKIKAAKARKIRSFAWDYFSKHTMINADVAHKLSERRMLFVRNR